ncbi:MAG: NADH:ubiquinone reductase (Na(+)-transporting) subunit C [Cyclobacteriaceae bacterium]|nr:NADH:ubiquinone reductase (Na(+)-transporting) subunit C [Cyclobacteriaceae bacterium]
MQRSNTYIIIFSLVLTIILGGLLSLASVGLRPAQKIAEELSAKRQILSAVMEVDPNANVLPIFDERISSVVIDSEGNLIESDEKGNPVDAANVDLEKQFKLAPEERMFPVFMFHEEGDPENITAYIFAFYGNGLWDNIWGYVALETDMNTIAGAVFDHAGETPGLGARITEQQIEDRYKGKNIFNDQGELVSVDMLKSENNPPNALDEHNINGLSGATITAKGVNKMLENYFRYYLPYIEKIKGKDKKIARSLN